MARYTIRSSDSAQPVDEFDELSTEALLERAQQAGHIESYELLHGFVLFRRAGGVYYVAPENARMYALRYLRGRAQRAG